MEAFFAFKKSYLVLPLKASHFNVKKIIIMITPQQTETRNLVFPSSFLISSGFVTLIAVSCHLYSLRFIPGSHHNWCSQFTIFQCHYRAQTRKWRDVTAQYREQFKWESPLPGITLLCKVNRSSLYRNYRKLITNENRMSQVLKDNLERAGFLEKKEKYVLFVDQILQL